MGTATSDIEIRPINIPESLGRFRITIAFVIISIAALILATFIIERMAQGIGEDAAVRSGTEVAAQQADLIAAMFTRVAENIDVSNGPDGVIDAPTANSYYNSGKIDPTTAAILLMSAGDFAGLLTSNDVRHISLHAADGSEIWEGGSEMDHPDYGGGDRAIAENRTVSKLIRQVQMESETGADNPKTIDVVQSFVPIGVDGQTPDMLLDLVLDVTDTLDAEIAMTTSAIRNSTVPVLGSILAMMSVIVFIGDVRLSNKSSELIGRERMIARRLDDENRELQRIDRAKNEFLSSVSHELKTPLAAVLGFTRIVKGNKRNNLDERDLRHLGTIERNGWRLNTLIDDLLELSRIESKRIRLQKESVDIKGVIEEIATSFEPILDGRDQTLTLHMHEGPAWLEVDKGRLIQVLTNIMSNAGKYSDSGTKISLRSEIREGHAVLSVTDQGRGMKPEDLENLFTLFFRSEEAEKSATPGTGIGLYISRKIVELHGGDISVESTYGSGTTMTVRLPGVTAKPQSEPTTGPRFMNRLENIPNPEQAENPGDQG
ncbi:MAG: HAMP domain-containing sensor histidine kinase [Dehalococcoidia bacterium]|jgi:signal transduction histidine kinase|nr:HAMP domain-containing sensor histidine kinase [Dehalococcoidia bacterium]